jgi:hypothetical protein
VTTRATVKLALVVGVVYTSVFHAVDQLTAQLHVRSSVLFKALTALLWMHLIRS